MERFRTAFDMARNLPDAQAEPALRELIREYPALPPFEEGSLRYALGLALFHQNRAEEARKEFFKAGNLLEKAPGVNLALAVTALARAELACGHLDESVKTGRRALELLRLHLPADDPRMAPSLFALSFGEYMARHLDRAEELNLQAKALWEKQRGPESLEVSTCLNNLGRIYEEAGRNEEGVAHHRAALAIRRKVLGDHPETAFSMGNLGTALAAANHWKEAAEMLEEAIACYARCGRTEGEDIEGYRYNLSICKKALS
ncbi:tetratricopeptide repeat protein [Mailhella massiliensis]|uniref:tetratricopeptide repeat protein n=1 Tax=Mailhella massiliensis TaxID=1903261 RepID=UPI0023EF9FD8|nr:tetratricopeptide repeat protein [Mailhella massiliensis]